MTDAKGFQNRTRCVCETLMPPSQLLTKTDGQGKNYLPSNLRFLGIKMTTTQVMIKLFKMMDTQK